VPLLVLPLLGMSQHSSVQLVFLHVQSPQLGLHPVHHQQVYRLQHCQHCRQAGELLVWARQLKRAYKQQ
jgi:hypothetical protein